MQKNASVAEIYFISTAEEQSKDYDSIEVIDERRNKSFGQMGVGSSTSSINAPTADHHHSGTGAMRNSNTNLERTDTVIYRDSYKREQRTAAAVDESGGVRGDTRDIGTNATQDTNALHQLTTKAEVEQRRSSNVSETDNSDVR